MIDQGPYTPGSLVVIGHESAARTGTLGLQTLRHVRGDSKTGHRVPEGWGALIIENQPVGGSIGMTSMGSLPPLLLWVGGGLSWAWKGSVTPIEEWIEMAESRKAGS